MDPAARRSWFSQWRIEVLRNKSRHHAQQAGKLYRSMQFLIAFGQTPDTNMVEQWQFELGEAERWSMEADVAESGDE